MKLILPILLGTAHALNDFFSGFILATYSNELSGESSTTLFLIYGALAFGGQIPIAIIINRGIDLKRATLFAISLLGIGIISSYGNSPTLTIMTIGIGSALLHVSAGTWVLKIAQQQVGITGIFVAPGVAGLTLGGILGSQNLTNIPLFTLIIGIALIISIWITSKSYNGSQRAEKSTASIEFDRHDGLMLLILAAICLRSLIWDIINLSYSGNNQNLILAIGLSAFIGKLLGGFLSDALGWKRWIQISLPLSSVFLVFFGDNTLAICTGAALLQSTTPVMVHLMYRVFPKEPAIAIGMTLGLGILLAGLPTYLPIVLKNLNFILIICCLVLPLYAWWLVRLIKKN
jgi:MFS family permease